MVGDKGHGAYDEAGDAEANGDGGVHDGRVEPMDGDREEEELDRDGPGEGEVHRHRTRRLHHQGDQHLEVGGGLR